MSTELRNPRICADSPLVSSVAMFLGTEREGIRGRRTCNEAISRCFADFSSLRNAFSYLQLPDRTCEICNTREQARFGIVQYHPRKKDIGAIRVQLCCWYKLVIQSVSPASAIVVPTMMLHRGPGSIKRAYVVQRTDQFLRLCFDFVSVLKRITIVKYPDAQ
jgi:hypothetical protein